MDCLNPIESAAAESPYEVLLRAVLLIPVSHYLLGLSLIVVVFLYNFLEIHILQDLFTGLRGQKVVLTFNPSSQLYRDVVSKCRVLHGRYGTRQNLDWRIESRLFSSVLLDVLFDGFLVLYLKLGVFAYVFLASCAVGNRYLSTPWLCSPHLQTVFLHFLGIRLLSVIEVKNLAYQVNDAVEQDDKKPIVIIIPGLTSDSNSADLNNSNVVSAEHKSLLFHVYVKHLAFSMAKRGWKNVLECKVLLESDCFYNAGWTEDVRKVIDHVHSQFPEAPLFLVGTSIGANILVKYLAEDGINAPIVGAAAICSPWDLLICDRFINRKLAQRFYNKALAIGLKDYAHLHEDVLSRLSNWEGVKKKLTDKAAEICIETHYSFTLIVLEHNVYPDFQSRSVRDFDDCATRVLDCGYILQAF
ncbi:hypothetical protein Sango_0508800 [Sesamum angolense]|uniref:Serine aminopeptidase S33 domain-containing protein n=1 Tax=Sesamum angolense TaxID=2727404 RepID=A0AAE1X466_9LAMI|nr:hypothetical protein Sango_0508800 [Sesamum angolense]